MSRTALLRRAVLVTALLTGLMAFDEYLPLLAADRGASPATTALALVGVGVAETLCVALAGRVARARGPVLGVLLALAAVTVGAGALLPLGPGFAAIALGWGVLQMLLVVVETRVQDEVTGDARATVTSVAGLGSEGVALGVLAVVGTGSVWVGLPVLVAALAAPLLGVAVLLARIVTVRLWPNPDGSCHSRTVANPTKGPAMRIADLIARKGSAVLTVPPDAPVSNLLEVLAERNVGAAVVCEGDRLAGIVSERDVVRHLHRRGAASSTRRSPRS